MLICRLFFGVFKRIDLFRFYTVAPIFCWVLILIIIVFHSIMSPIISILTVFKGVFFIGTVRILERFLYQKDLSNMFIYKIIVTFVIGLKHQVPIKTNFGDTGDSFLMSLVSLGKISYQIFLEYFGLNFSRFCQWHAIYVCSS